jgi:hypothetical protein
MGDESLLYNHEKMTMTYLNGAAAAIWRLCDGERTLGEIIDFLASAYPGMSTRLENDVHATIQEFIDGDMLRLD